MAVIKIFPVILQTVINLRMLSIGGRGMWYYETRWAFLHSVVVYVFRSPCVCGQTMRMRVTRELLASSPRRKSGNKPRRERDRKHLGRRPTKKKRFEFQLIIGWMVREDTRVAFLWFLKNDVESLPLLKFASFIMIYFYAIFPVGCALSPFFAENWCICA